MSTSLNLEEYDSMNEAPMDGVRDEEAPSEDLGDAGENEIVQWEKLLAAFKTDDINSVKAIIKKQPGCLFMYTELDKKKKYLLRHCIGLIPKNGERKSFQYLLDTVSNLPSRPGYNEEDNDTLIEMLFDVWNYGLIKDDVHIIRQTQSVYPKFLNDLDLEGRTNLDYCVLYGSLEVFKYFIAETFLKNYVNTTSDSGCTPLLRVARRVKENHLPIEKAKEFATLLFKCGANPFCEFKMKENYVGWKDFIDDQSPLYELFESFENHRRQESIQLSEAIQSEDKEKIIELCKANSDLLDSCWEVQLGESMVRVDIETYCLWEKKYNVLRCLLENFLRRRINEFKNNKNGLAYKYPLFFQLAEWYQFGAFNRAEMRKFAKLLLDFGADPGVVVTYTEKEQIYTKSISDYSFWRELLDAKYELTENENKLDKLLKSEKINIEEVIALIKLDDKLINKVDFSGRNLLHISALKHNFKLFMFFLNHKYQDARAYDDVLDARRVRYEKLRREYLRDDELREFNIDAQDGHGCTPLYRAIEHARTEVEAREYVRELLVRGADPLLADWNQVGPVHVAAKKGYGTVVIALIDSAIVGCEPQHFTNFPSNVRNEIMKNVVPYGVADSLGMNFMHHAFVHGRLLFGDTFHTDTRCFYDPRVVELCMQENTEGYTPLYLGLIAYDIAVRKATNAFIHERWEFLSEKIRGFDSLFSDLQHVAQEEFEESAAEDDGEEKLLDAHDERGENLIPPEQSLQKLKFAFEKLLEKTRPYTDPNYDYKKRRNEQVGLLFLSAMNLLNDLSEKLPSFKKNLVALQKAQQDDSATYNQTNREEKLQAEYDSYTARVTESISEFLACANKVCNSSDEVEISSIISIAKNAGQLVLGDSAKIKDIIYDQFGVADIDERMDKLLSSPSESGRSPVDSVDENDSAEEKTLADVIEVSYNEKQVTALIKQRRDAGESFLGETKEGRSLFHLATDKNFLGVLECLVQEYKEQLQVNVEEAKSVFAKDDLGMNFLHVAFGRGNQIRVAQLFNHHGSYDPIFGELLREKDSDGDYPIYLGMKAKDQKARKDTQQFVIGLRECAHRKIRALVGLINFDEIAMRQLQSALNGLMDKAKFFDEPKFDIHVRHNVDTALLYLSVVEFLSNISALGQQKAEIDLRGDEGLKENYNQLAAESINQFLLHAKEATSDDRVFDTVLTVAIVAFSALAGLCLGILVGAFIAYMTGLTTALFLGLSLIELLGGGIGFAGGVVSSSLGCRFGLFGAQHDIEEACSIAQEGLRS